MHDFTPEEDPLKWLMQIAINEYYRRGRVGVYRNYYGPKDVIEWEGNGFTDFWKVWKVHKQEAKAMGFGVWRDRTQFIGLSPYYIIFCETQHILQFEKDVEKYFKQLEEKQKILDVNRVKKNYQDKKISAAEAINILDSIIELLPYEKIDEVAESLEFLTELSDKNVNLRKKLESIAISHNWAKLRTKALFLLGIHFPKTAKKIFDFCLKSNDPKWFLYGLIVFNDYKDYCVLADCVEDPLLKRIFSKQLAESTIRTYLNKYFRLKEVG